MRGWMGRHRIVWDGKERGRERRSEERMGWGGRVAWEKRRARDWKEYGWKRGRASRWLAS